jgi:Calcineurin-like phosphoesterase
MLIALMSKLKKKASGFIFSMVLISLILNLMSCGANDNLVASPMHLPDPTVAVINDRILSRNATSATILRAQVQANGGDGTNAVNASNLFDWAESAYPSFFPQHQTNQTFQAYTFRYYPSTQNYLGLSSNNVYVMGPISAGVLTWVGALSDFNCALNPSSCANKANSVVSSSMSTSGASALNNGFDGNLILGIPTNTSITASVFSPDQNASIYLTYGLKSAQPTLQTPVVQLVAGQPTNIALSNLLPDTAYFYQLNVQLSNSKNFVSMGEYSFHTARSPGSSFVFAIQGDSHPERFKTQFDANLYSRTLTTASNDHPDFYMTSGDDFSVDTLDPNTINQSAVAARYTLQRPYLGIIGASAPVFLTNGNHEQAARYLLDGTANNVAVWAQNARNTYYVQPSTDSFYSGNTEQIPFIGLLKNYFSWTWGDALFCVIDPYWESPVPVDNVFAGSAKRSNMWDVSHGAQQYQWLKSTLENSKAKFKFVFAHHVMGTGRGGIDIANLWEWGGYDNSNAYLFTQNRPDWVYPIHHLLVKNNVSIFFQGHDHIWVHQKLDGVTYQTLPEPADPFYALYNSDAYLTGERFPNSGYTRVSVSPTQVKVEYVRTYLQADEGPGKVSGQSVFSYTIP